ncbi:MAG: hypothetical protein D8M61_08770 [Ignavibacteriae bacterium]|nr:hypothetical protein [Ignavibacteriota bacterium]
MNRLFVILIMSGILVLIGCEDKPEAVEMEDNTQMSASMKKIEVLEHMNAAGYTYILANEDGNEYWIAIAQMPVEAGETLYYTQSMEMKNFTSKALDRTFDSILFVEGVSKDGKTTQQTRNPMMGSNPHSGAAKAEKADVDVDPVKGGISVKELYANKSDYSGKTVKMKGVVTKYNGSIMNRNWIHIQDGTSYESHNDITVTSDQTTKVGETIIVEGKLILDKDFGSGYKYAAIIEEAKIIKE